jgi:hypothetical protein
MDAQGVWRGLGWEWVLYNVLQWPFSWHKHDKNKDVDMAQQNE